MRRRLLTIAIFLLAGAVMNVAVAWGCAVTPSATLAIWIAPTQNSDEDRRWGSHHAPADFPRTTEGRTRSPVVQSVGIEVVTFYEKWDGKMMANGTGALAIRSRYGWPVLAVEGAVWYKGGPSPLGSLLWWLWRVPLLPIWPGFAINTLFYAVILWLAIPGPFALRRFIRVRRGLCPKCAYPIGESAVCTECGAELGGPTR